MEAIVYKTEEERLEALRRMVGLRKIWEAHVRELMAKHPEMLVAQWSLHTEGMTIDNVHYFSSILLRKDHPLHNQVLSAFHDFIVEHSQS